VRKAGAKLNTTRTNRRAAALREFRAKALQLVSDARLCGMDDPVAIIADLATSTGRRIAVETFGQAAVDAAMAAADGGLEAGYSCGVWLATSRPAWLPLRSDGKEIAIIVGCDGLQVVEIERNDG